MTTTSTFKPYVTACQRTNREYVSHRLTVNVQPEVIYLNINTGDDRGHHVQVMLEHADLLTALAAMHAAGEA